MGKGMGVWTVSDLPHAIRNDPRNAAVLLDTQAIPAAILDTPKRPAFWPYRSQLEQDYARVLDGWHATGYLRQWVYESHCLTLAPKTTLTVDFYLWMADGSHQLHETKGKWYREDGWQKLKQAAARFPGYRFFRVQHIDGEWTWREVPAA